MIRNECQDLVKQTYVSSNPTKKLANEGTVGDSCGPVVPASVPFVPPRKMIGHSGFGVEFEQFPKDHSLCAILEYRSRQVSCGNVEGFGVKDFATEHDLAFHYKPAEDGPHALSASKNVLFEFRLPDLFGKGWAGNVFHESLTLLKLIVVVKVQHARILSLIAMSVSR